MTSLCSTLTYYEKWARSLGVILKERGTITQAEIDAAAGCEDAGQPAVRYTIASFALMPEGFHSAEVLCVS